MSQPPNQSRGSEDIRLWLFRLGTQYYASGRFAFRALIVPVAANLLHHAIEMYLKGTLAHVLDLRSMKGLSHNLATIWKRTRLEFPDPRLAGFDGTIARLHPFEKLRYPDAMVTSTMTIQYFRLREHRQPLPKSAVSHGTEYELVLEEIDELVPLLFELAEMSSEFLHGEFGPAVHAALAEDNNYPIFRPYYA